MKKGIVCFILSGAFVSASAFAQGSSASDEITDDRGTVCEVSAHGQVRCFGSNFEGRLGQSKNRTESIDRSENIPWIDVGTSEPLRKLAIGNDHMCALFASGIKCWGSNTSGLLGYGDTRTRGDHFYRTEEPRIPVGMGKDLPFVDLGTAARVVDIAVDRWMSCALFETGLVKCWGDGWGDKPGEMGTNLPYVDTRTAAKPTGFVRIPSSTPGEFSFALKFTAGPDKSIHLVNGRFIAFRLGSQ